MAKARKTRHPSKPIPTTLLSGFLGAGKTTLLQHVLRSNHGLRIAVIVNDIGAINVDASLIKQTHRLTKTNEKVIALQNGCICCTLRGDLLEEILRLSQLQQFDYIIIESSGISEPEQVAESFDVRLAEQMDLIAETSGDTLSKDMVDVLRKITAAGGLEKFARLDTTVTVIDAFTIMQDFDTDELISARRDDVTPEDERTVSDLMVDQIEFAEVIVLNKIDMVESKTRTQVIALIRKLNHRAKVLETSHGKVDVKEIVNTGLFNLEVAQTGYGWLQDLHSMTAREMNGRSVITPKPETEEYNVQSCIYRRYRPFHPRRLFAVLYDKFILQMEHQDEEDDEEDDDDEIVEVGDDRIASSKGAAHDDVCMDEEGDEAEDGLEPPPNAIILQNKRKDPLFARLFRSKGEFFLATRPHRAGDWSQAGSMLTMTGGRPWFCTLPPEEYTTGDAQVDGLVQHDIRTGGEWGDRRQELVFIGEKLDRKGLEELLDGCLLSDSEYETWQTIMRDETLGLNARREALETAFDDGFPDWAGDEEEDEAADDCHNHAGHAH